MMRYGLKGSQRKQAIAWFRRGKELDAVLECLNQIARSTTPPGAATRWKASKTPGRPDHFKSA